MQSCINIIQRTINPSTVPHSKYFRRDANAARTTLQRQVEMPWPWGRTDLGSNLSSAINPRYNVNASVSLSVMFPLGSKLVMCVNKTTVPGTSRSLTYNQTYFSTSLRYRLVEAVGQQLPLSSPRSVSRRWRRTLCSPAMMERLQPWLQQHKQHHEEKNECHGAGSGSHYGQRRDPKGRVRFFV